MSIELGTSTVPQVSALPGTGIAYQVVGYNGSIYFWDPISSTWKQTGGGGGGASVTWAIQDQNNLPLVDINPTIDEFDVVTTCSLALAAKLDQVTFQHADASAVAVTIAESFDAQVLLVNNLSVSLSIDQFTLDDFTNSVGIALGSGSGWLLVYDGNTSTTVSTTLTAPSGLSSSTTAVSGWGPGGNGGLNGSTGGGGGGGGGSWGKVNALSFTPGTTTFTITIPQSGNDNFAWVSTTGSYPASTATGVGVPNGKNGANGSTSQGAGGAGGNAAGGISDTSTNGGAGGGGGGVATANGGGGGGSGGATSAGGAGTSAGVGGAAGTPNGAVGGGNNASGNVPGSGGGGKSTLSGTQGIGGVGRIVFAFTF